jgi:hypothetical protein
MPGKPDANEQMSRTKSKQRTNTMKNTSKTLPKTKTVSNTSQRKCNIKTKKTQHKGGTFTDINLSKTITDKISDFFQKLIPSFLNKGSKSFVSKFEAKHVADKGSETTFTANFQFIVRNSYDNILIDFQNLYIDEKFRGKGILGNIFKKVEEMIYNYSNDPNCEKRIIIRVSDFNNFLLGCHFVLQRGYDLYNPYRPQETNKEKMQEFVNKYKFASDIQSRQQLLQEYTQYIPPNAQKVYVSDKVKYPWLSQSYVHDFGFVSMDNY